MSDASPTVPVNLAFRVSELVAGLKGMVAQGRWLDATLAAGAILQGVDDAVAGTASGLGRFSKTVSKASPVASRVVFARTRSAQVFKAKVPVMAAQAKRIVLFREIMSDFAIHAALFATHAESGSALSTDEVFRLFAELPRDVREAVIRIPSSFRSFDQHPRDLQRLVDKFAVAQPDRRRPIVVLGVRTSGSYLAPFIAAYLREAGYLDVVIVSARSEQPLLVDDAARVRQYAAKDALVVVADDPPSSGYALDSVCKSLSTYGVKADDIVLMLASFEDSEKLPERLARYSSVVLPWSEWFIHERLSAENVKRHLATLLGRAPHTCEVTRFSENSRGHESVRVSCGKAQYVAQGVGIGFFGEHERVVAEGLQPIAPKVLGVVDGVLYREWLDSDETQLVEADDVVSYLQERVRLFAVEDDRSLAFAGTQPVWEVASTQIAKVYGKFWPIARMIYVDRLARSLVKADKLAVVDGSMSSQSWIHVDGQTRKLDVAKNAFGNRDLVSFDPAYDAIAYALDTGDAEVISKFAERIEAISPEKQLLYELVRIWDDHRGGLHDRYRSAERRGSAYRRYLSHIFFSGVKPNETGPIVAIDVDGVLESEFMGFKAPTPSSALAVRALIRHGYRPILVTGRCVADVLELHDLFKLSGGVAEYGSALVHGQEVRSTVTPEQSAALDRLRTSLRDTKDVHIDERYQHIVRASSVAANGKLKTLDPSLYEAILDSGIEPVFGNLQTDFVASGTDKGTGVSGFAQMVNAEKPVLAIGDTDADVSLLESAQRAAVPAHATAKAKAVAQYVSKSPYQVGLSDIVGDLIGHRPGNCSDCSFDIASSATRAFIDLLRVSEGAQRSIPRRTLRAVISAIRV